MAYALRSSAMAITLENLNACLDRQKKELLEVFQKQKDDLLNELGKQKEDLLAEFDRKSNEWNVALQMVIDDARASKVLAEKNAGDILRLQSTVDTLVDTNKYQAAQIVELTNKVEDRTNRQLRNTLVFKGVREEEGEKSWDDTTAVLAKTIANIVPGLDVEEAKNIFERVHRGKPHEDGSTRRPRNIFAKVYRWCDAEHLKDDFRKANIANPDLKVYCEQKFGPLTTARRSHAMLVRRDLKKEKKIHSGFVAFPAKLLVKYTPDRKEKYVPYDNFSNMEVVFNNRKS